MQWILRGRQIGQAVKNVQRLRQIVGTLAKHGFADVIVRMNLGRFLMSRAARLKALTDGTLEKSIPQRLRECFEELGPTFVKLGQLLSTRPDLIPESFVEEFVKLQDNVHPLPFEAIKSVIEKELGKKTDQLFSAIDPLPLASASIAQVHLARLTSGENVVIKVQRPEIDRTIKNDISLLGFIARMMEKYIPESRIVGPTTIVEEFFKTLSYELDFLVEANNTAKIAHNLSDFPDIVIPKIHKNMSTQRVLTMQRIEGIRLNDTKAIEASGVDKSRIVEIGARAFFKTVMIDGLFHGDLHGGNLFVLPGNKLGIIDFGIVGRLSERSRDRLANMFMSLLTEDYENLCFQYAELGAVDPSVDFQSFEREVRNAVAPYIGLNISEVNSGRVFIESTKIAAKYNIRVPGDWMIVFKALLTMEGMGRALDPNFDLLSLGQDLVKELIKNQYSVQRLKKDFIWIGKDLAALLQILPRQIRWMFKKFNRNDFAVEIKVPELAELRGDLVGNSKRLSLSLVAGALFIAGSLALGFTTEQQVAGLPIVAFTLLLGGLLFLLKLLFL